QGDLGDLVAARELVRGADALVHSALARSGTGSFTGGMGGDTLRLLQTNLVGTLQLFQSAYEASGSRCVSVSACAVHDVILDARPLDEAPPLWPQSHYGAHKAALEKFVHSYGFGRGWAVCSLRPTGIYGLAHPPRDSKWFGLVGQVLRGE